jgi:two-component system cell cycle response regulator DivK
MIRKKLILLAEDNRDVADIMSYALSSLGYEAAIAFDGVEAVEKAIALEPDLIIMDMLMPRLDGFQVASQLRQRPDTKNIPILAATALATVEDRKRCLESGCDDVILKPFTPKDLAPVIERLLQHAPSKHSEDSQGARSQRG